MKKGKHLTDARQMEMNVIGLVKKRKPLQDAPTILVAQCTNYRESVLLCIQLGHVTQDQVAEHLGIDKGTFNHILRRGGSEKRKRYLDPDMIEAIELFCGNRAPTQYFDFQSRGLLNRQNKSARAAELRRELELLEAS